MDAAIEIRRLRLRARHGVLGQERVCGNVFEVSAVLTVDYDGSDCLESTVSYADVVETIKREMAEPSALLEHVACRIGQAVCREFPRVSKAVVTVDKLRPPMSAEMDRVGVTVSVTGR